MDYLQLAKKYQEQLIQYRQHLHQNPELSGEEVETVAFICEKLREFKIPFVEVENGGVLGFIDGTGEGKRILLRADCDALPMEESLTNDKHQKSCVSKNQGISHTCGHDFHTASLLVAAKILLEQKAEWKGHVLLYFERSEEKGGLFQYNLLKYIENHNITINACFGFHVNVGRAGLATVIEGPSHAGSFSFQYTVQGQGGHGARPYMANNPIPCFQAIAADIDRIRMNKVDPYMPVTLTICNVHAGQAANVIPDTISFGGNGRYFNREKAGMKIAKELDWIVRKCADIHDCEVIEGKVSTPGIPNLNHVQCAKFAFKVLEEQFGKEQVIIGEPSMGSETFAYLSALYPSFLLFFGVTNEEKGISYGIHHPKFDIDEDKVYLATAYTLAYAVEFLNGDVSFPRDGCLDGIDDLKEIF